MLVFTYGTLKKDFSNHHILERVQAKYLGEVHTVLKYPMFNLNDTFPYLQDNPGIGEIIKGDLFYIDEIHEEYLDSFEGVPELYKSGIIEVIYNNEIVFARCYFKAEEVKLDLDFISEFRED